jgi:hypothetical protein
MSETFDANNLPSTETNIPPFVCIPIPCFNSLASAPYALKVDIDFFFPTNDLSLPTFFISVM